MPSDRCSARPELQRTLLDEVNITVHRDDPALHASLVLQWKGGAIRELTVPLRTRSWSCTSSPVPAVTARPAAW
jgi:hypothetical protein